MLIVHGVDLVDISDFSEIVKLFNEYLDRYFTPTELADAGCSTNRIARLAGRLAVKEAVLKALGNGFGDGISMTDIEVCTRESGAACLLLHGGAARLAASHGVTSWLLSTSHTEGTALASVIGIGD
jgi:holo-[acyl-carrier protein] synthase